MTKRFKFFQCGDINCKRTCDSSELFCVVLDDNGYVIVTYNRAPRSRIGSFFGDFRPDIMRQLVEEGIYRPHRMYDYQGTCFPRIATNNPASKYMTVRCWFARKLQFLLVTFFITAGQTSNRDLEMERCPIILDDQDRLGQRNGLSGSRYRRELFGRRSIL